MTEKCGQWMQTTVSGGVGSNQGQQHSHLRCGETMKLIHVDQLGTVSLQHVLGA